MRIELPQTFDDITIGMIQAHGERDIDEIEKVRIYAGLTMDEITKMPYKLIQEGADHIDRLLEIPTNKHLKVIDVGGELFGFIPDWTKFTTGEYIDMDELSKNVTGNAKKIMAILYRPITRQYKDAYTIEEYEGATKYADRFKDVSASYFYGALVFFSTTRNEYAKTSVRYLMTGAKTILNASRKKKDLRNGGRGTILSMLWRWKTLLTLRR